MMKHQSVKEMVNTQCYLPLDHKSILHDRIHVSVRVKPFQNFEPKVTPWQVIEGHTIINKNNKKESFTFDRVFTEKVDTQEVFDKDIKFLVRNALKGYNVTIAAYG